ncbi:excinuclease ATPase subunit [Rhodoferax sp.]|uniref:excinuclease ATPase subunit n=1 Tax=Rhodoferax sp. TaxID=50421 RepID=UPI00374D2B4F
MKKTFLLPSLLLAIGAMWVAPASARNVAYQISLAELLKTPEAQAKLDSSVKFYLSGQTPPAVEQSFGEDHSHRSGIGSVKEEVELATCRAETLSVLAAFQAKAKKLGANAIVDIYSFYKNEVSKNPATIECHAGTFRIHVVLKATYAKVAVQ